MDDVNKIATPVLDRSGEPRAYERIRTQIMDLQTENIAELAVRAKSLTDVITLWYGEGDLVTPDFIRDAAKASLDAGNTFYVPDMRGLPALTEALSAYLTNLHGRDIPVPRSTITPGGMQAVFLALELIVDRGDNVVFIEPQWPNIKSAIHVVGGEPRPVALRYENNDWRLDLDELFARCDARTKAIMFSTPSNPLGWTASPEELEELIAFSRPIDGAELADWKQLTNVVEAEFGGDDFPTTRPLNLDPGYITQAKLVLATTKDRDHRIYLRDGIFGEITLTYTAKKWIHHRWTYPDYRTEKVAEFAMQCRDHLRASLQSGDGFRHR